MLINKMREAITAQRLEDTHFKIAKAAPELDQQRIAGIADRLDLVAPLQKP